MPHDYWSTMQLWRSLRSTQKEACVSEIAKLDLGDFRRVFLERILSEEAFDNMGNNAQLVDELKRHPKVCGNIPIEKLAKKVAADARQVLLTHDNSMFEAGFWNYTKIPGIEMDLLQMNGNIHKRGIHLVHGGIGAGKTENVLIPEAKKIPDGKRALVIVPNVNRVYEIAAELGWPHYHAFGKSAEDVKKAFATFDKIVSCAPSVRKIVEDGDFIPYHELLSDELCEIFRYADYHGKGNPSDAQWWESLQAIFQLMNYCDRFIGFTADAPTGFVISTLEKAAKEMHRDAFYYKTMESYAKHQNYHLVNSEEDLIWSVANNLNKGLSAWGYCDFSDAYKPYLSRFGHILRRLCPDKKIEWIDSKKVKESVLAQPIREMGLVGYIKHKRREGELDCLMTSPYARSQYSLLWGEDEEDLIFDFAFACARNADIGSPQDADQGLGRSRQTKNKIVYIREANGGTSVVEKNSGAKSLLKQLQKEADLSDAEAWEKTWWHCRTQSEQYRLANRASRKWLFKELVEQRGAKVNLVEMKIPSEDVAAYMKIAAEVKAEVEDSEKEKPLENTATKRLDRLHKAYQSKKCGWGLVNPNDIDEKELEKCLKIDAFTADRVFQILLQDEETRELYDRGVADAYYRTTGAILDKIVFELFEQTELRTQRNFFDWFVNGDDSTWFVIDTPIWEGLEPIVEGNFELLQKTLGRQLNVGPNVDGFLKMVGECIGLDFVRRVDREERTKWRDALFADYRKNYGGKFPKSVRTGSKAGYDKIAEILIPKFHKIGFVPTYEERRFLDTRPEVCRVTKKRFVARDVVGVYRHYLFALQEKGLITPAEPPPEFEEAILS